MAYNPNTSTHLAYSDRSDLWCVKCGMYCSARNPCTCDRAPAPAADPPAETAEELETAETLETVEQLETSVETLETEVEKLEPAKAEVSADAGPQAEVHFITDGDAGVAGESHG